MKIYGEWTTLDKLEPGSMFETRDGIRALKTEYRSQQGKWECYLLASGESAWFDKPSADKGHNETEVRTIYLEALLACVSTTNPAYARGLQDGRNDAMNKLQSAADELRAAYTYQYECQLSADKKEPDREV